MIICVDRQLLIITRILCNGAFVVHFIVGRWREILVESYTGEGGGGGGGGGREGGRGGEAE